MVRYALVLAVAATLGVATATAQKIDLDLTTATRPIPAVDPSSEGGVTVSVGGARSSHEETPTPLRMRLLRTARSCEAGEPMVFDVELQNISGNTLMLPWTLDSSNQGHSESPLVFPVMKLRLRLSSPDVPEAVEGGDTLYGDPSDAFTMRKLAPQERVVIRGSAVCSTVNRREERSPRRGAQAFRIYAVVSLGHGGTTFGRSIESNSLPLEIVYQQP